MTVVAPPQLSDVVTLAIFGAGTWLAHCTVTFAGQEMDVVLSITVNVTAHVAVLPVPSAIVNLLVMTNGLAGQPVPPLLVSVDDIEKLLQKLFTVIPLFELGGTLLAHWKVPPLEGGHVTLSVQQPCTVILLVAVQPLASVTVTVYVPGGTFKRSSVKAPLDHINVYGG